MFDFSGRTALITGAGQGMGAGIAQALASRGAHVFINDLFEDRANAAAKSISSTGHKATPLAGDITDTDFRAAMQTQIEAKGTLDILVNNAGVPTDMAGSFAGAETQTETHYHRQMDLNYHAVRHLCAAFIPGMKARNYGRILVITSESWRLGSAMGLTHYAAAKAASVGYMRNIARELGPHGVTANALSLGAMNNFDGHEIAAKATAIGRAGSPEDAAAAAIYLCSSEASWMTGQTIALNGGASTA